MRTHVSMMIVVASFSACADEAPAPRPSAAPGVVLGADGVGQDEADFDCAVVLRSVARVPSGTGGWLTTAEGHLVWEGALDVDRAVADQSLGVAVVFRTTESRGAWYAAAATRADDHPDASATRFARYTFRLDTFTPKVGTSTTSLARTVIELAPFVATTDGGRLFDHNRVADPLGAYVLDAGNQWTIDPGAADDACPASDDGIARWTFSYPDFAEQLDGGPVAAGGQVRIAYDGRRLREVQGCMGAHGPTSATTLYLSYMIDGDAGAVGTAEVERYVVNAGAVRQEVFEPVIDVPAGASDLAVWFSCVPGFGAANNVRWDSDEGRNYHLAIVAPARSPDRVDWMGAMGLFRARPGDVMALAEPLGYDGFTNMGLAIQLEVWADGVAAQDLVVHVESDALACTPGGALTRERVPLAATGAGPFGNNLVFRWGFESLLGRCPSGTYRYRFVASADGGLTTTTLGAAAQASPEAPDPSFRTILHRGR